MQNHLKREPVCPYGNNAKYVCLNAQCRKPGLICQKAESTHSQCWLFHQNCTKVKWAEVEVFTKQNIHTKTSQFIYLQEKIQSLFLKTLDKIRSEHEKFNIWTKTYGHSLQAMKFIKILMDKDYEQITGDYMSSVMPALLSKQPKRIESPIIAESDFQNVKGEIDRILQRISGLYLKSKKVEKSLMSDLGDVLNISGSNLYINGAAIVQLKSKIIQNLNPVQPYFDGRKIKSAKLIYRASDYNFSIKRFHELCDNIPDTLTLIHNEFGKKFGGYTPVAWTSDKKHWVADKSLRSFIFSLDMGEKFKLNLAQFAIASNPQRGPTFGCCDICIMDNSHKEKSNCQFPISYNNNGKYLRSPNTSTSFTGHPKGQFLVKDWEVFRLGFQ